METFLSNLKSAWLAWLIWASVFPGSFPAAQPSPAKWEADIAAFEVSDKKNPPPRRAVLFIGSSSIRLWKTMAEDFPNQPVINRGFGGSHVADVTYYADRIVTPYRPRLIVLYAGDNDLAGGKSPEQVLADFQAFVQKVHGVLPKTRIAFISVKPSPSRWQLADQARTANRLVAGRCQKDRRLVFIDVFTAMIGVDNQPRAELFQADRLHLNAQGYELWRSLIKPALR